MCVPFQIRSVYKCCSILWTGRYCVSQQRAKVQFTLLCVLNFINVIITLDFNIHSFDTMAVMTYKGAYRVM